jgi:hypothetical protein
MALDHTLSLKKFSALDNLLVVPEAAQQGRKISREQTVDFTRQTLGGRLWVQVGDCTALKIDWVANRQRSFE